MKANHVQTPSRGFHPDEDAESIEFLLAEEAKDAAIREVLDR